VVDSDEEIARLAYLTDPAPGQTPAARVQVLVRVATGVAATAYEFVASEHEDQKFGFSLASGAAAEAARRVVASPGLDLAGLHTHIGSQIFATDGFEMAARRVAGLAAQIRDELGQQISELSLGGGFGISYTPDDDPADVEVIAQHLLETGRAQWTAHGLAVPRLAVEPGRAIAGPGTITLYEVGTVKDVDGLRSYVSVDGGMSDNIRTALYGAEYTCVLASRESAAPPMLCRVVGRHCESGDIVVKDCYLPSDLVPGGLVAVAATGAYCRSMASNYNHVTRPAVVTVADGSARLLVRRETIDDLLRLDAG
jgi:diaminopimelate decarboxylase